MSACVNDRSHPYKCILHGGCGAVNTGDLLISALCLKDRRREFGTSVAMLTPNPGCTSYAFPGVPTIHYLPERIPFRAPHLLHRGIRRIGLGRPDPKSLDYYTYDRPNGSRREPEWVDHIRRCECLCLIGGGYFMDLYDCLDYYLLPVAVAKQSSRRIIMSPNGFGPFERAGSFEKLAYYFEGVEIHARDEESVAVCKSAGLQAKFVPDDGFRCREIVDFPSNKGTSLNQRLKIGVDIYPQYGGTSSIKVRSWWVHFLKQLHELDVDIEGFCFHADPLLDFSETRHCFHLAGLSPQAVHCPKLDFRESCLQLSDFDAIASSRFHPVVISNTLGKPALAIADGTYYVNKMSAACKGHSKSHVINPHLVPSSRAVDLLWEQIDRTRIRLNSITPA